MTTIRKYGCLLSTEKFDGYELVWPVGYHKMSRREKEASLKRLAAESGGEIVGSVVRVDK